MVAVMNSAAKISASLYKSAEFSLRLLNPAAMAGAGALAGGLAGGGIGAASGLLAPRGEKRKAALKRALIGALAGGGIGALGGGAAAAAGRSHVADQVMASPTFMPEVRNNLTALRLAKDPLGAASSLWRNSGVLPVTNQELEAATRQHYMNPILNDIKFPIFNSTQMPQAIEEASGANDPVLARRRLETLLSAILPKPQQPQ